jgi:hypothetical protein
MIKYKIKQIMPGIFVVEFTDKYDLAMTFLRYQEFYESPNKKFKGNQFTLVDYIEWYSKENGNVFTYPNDWCGFNIPSRIIYEVQSNSTGQGLLLDRNKYDELMVEISNDCILENKITLARRSFYLIGILKGDINTMKHEIAHALYNTRSFYANTMNELYWKLPKKCKKHLEINFKQMGYHKSVWEDEAQAYLSTGNEYLGQSERKPFVDAFEKFTAIIKWK